MCGDEDLYGADKDATAPCLGFRSSQYGPAKGRDTKQTGLWRARRATNAARTFACDAAPIARHGTAGRVTPHPKSDRLLHRS